MKKLKIGLFLDNYYPNIDGVIMVVENLAKEMAKHHEVTLVIPQTKCNNQLKIYNTIRIKSIHIPFIKYNLGIKTKKQFKRLVGEKFDVIHIHSPFTIGKLGIEVAKELKIPVIATMHTRFDWEIKRIINSKIIINYFIKKIINVYNKCDKSIAVNTKIAMVYKEYGYLNDPIIINNGTDLKTIKNINRSLNEINKLYNLNKNETLFLFVGRIISIKNIFYIIKVLKELDKENIDFKMLFVGSGPDEKKLKRKIEKNNLTKKVFMLGKITNRELLAKIYLRSDLFLFPSLFDASSLVQIEAASQYTPTLFIKNSITSDTIINDYNGFTSEDNIKSYKNKIKEILNNNKKLKKVAFNAKETLTKNWKKIAEETLQVYFEEIKHHIH